MKLYKIINTGRDMEIQELVCDELNFAESFQDRLFGLVFKNIRKGQGFVITGCSSIHTFWMRYRIDTVFLDKDLKIIKAYESLGQFRITPAIKGAHYVIELPEFTVKGSGLKTGTQLRFA
jgi:uncharacterized membrane protein (UPF0127 family)